MNVTLHHLPPSVIGAMSTLPAPARWIPTHFTESKLDTRKNYSHCRMMHGDVSLRPTRPTPRQFRQRTVSTVLLISKSYVSATTNPHLPFKYSKHSLSSSPTQPCPRPPASLALTSESATGTSDPSSPPSEPPLRVMTLIARDICADSFAPYGTLVGPTEDGTPSGPQDADLDLTQGHPRYISPPHRSR